MVQVYTTIPVCGRYGVGGAELTFYHRRMLTALKRAKKITLCLVHFLDCTRYARKKAVSLSHCLVHTIISQYQILCDIYQTSHRVVQRLHFLACSLIID
jgi:hypothetical protein